MHSGPARHRRPSSQNIGPQHQNGRLFRMSECRIARLFQVSNRIETRYWTYSAT